MKVSNLPSFPSVMGIINVTPDSFYAASRVQEEQSLRERVRQIVGEGGTMIDVGAYSTRPGAAEVTAAEELDRLRWALPIVREEAPATMISVDTFRAHVAEVCVTELGADVINDVTGGVLDPEMLDVVIRTRAYYIMMHWVDSTQDIVAWQVPDARWVPDHQAPIVERVKAFFGHQLEQLGEARRQVILDPGFGFSKSLAQNYELMRGLDVLREAFADLPMLVGISRKSMIYRLLDITPEQALGGTTVLNTYALMHGAAILRVHDVKEAVEAVKICGNLA